MTDCFSKGVVIPPKSYITHEIDFLQIILELKNKNYFGCSLILIKKIKSFIFVWEKFQRNNTWSKIWQIKKPIDTKRSVKSHWTLLGSSSGITTGSLMNCSEIPILRMQSFAIQSHLGVLITQGVKWRDSVCISTSF